MARLCVLEGEHGTDLKYLLRLLAHRLRTVIASNSSYGLGDEWNTSLVSLARMSVHTSSSQMSTSPSANCAPKHLDAASPSDLRHDNATDPEHTKLHKIGSDRLRHGEGMSEPPRMQRMWDTECAKRKRPQVFTLKMWSSLQSRTAKHNGAHC